MLSLARGLHRIYIYYQEFLLPATAIYTGAPPPHYRLASWAFPLAGFSFCRLEGGSQRQDLAARGDFCKAQLRSDQPLLLLYLLPPSLEHCTAGHRKEPADQIRSLASMSHTQMISRLPHRLQ